MEFGFMPHCSFFQHFHKCSSSVSGMLFVCFYFMLSIVRFFFLCANNSFTNHQGGTRWHQQNVNDKLCLTRTECMMLLVASSIIKLSKLFYKQYKRLEKHLKSLICLWRVFKRELITLKVTASRTVKMIHTASVLLHCLLNLYMVQYQCCYC